MISRKELPHFTAMHYAAEHDQLTVVQLLVAAKANLSIQDEVGQV